MIISGRKEKLSGDIQVPGDKSISHRGVILGALADGITTIDNILISEDLNNTIKCFKDMGVKIERKGTSLLIEGVGLQGLKQAEKPLDCGNSGTTMRLLSGVMLGQSFDTILVGDDSLSKRPMDRIIEPLTMMGGSIQGKDEKYPPLDIRSINTSLSAISYKLPVASAQVKSSILLAGLYSKGSTTISEGRKTRDHTERMLDYFGANIYSKDGIIKMGASSSLKGRHIYIPGDISSAAYFMVAGSLIQNSHVRIRDVNINPTRTGIFNVLKNMGADIQVHNKRIKNLEPIGDIEIRHSVLKGADIGGAQVPTMIDEIPIIAVAAALAKGRTIIRDVEELRHKECDRIRAMYVELSKMGANIRELPDGLIIDGVDTLRPAVLNSYKDHRIAMALSIAALNAEGESTIKGHESVNISYPDFYETLEKIL